MIYSSPVTLMSDELNAQLVDSQSRHALFDGDGFREGAYVIKLKSYLKKRYNQLLDSGKRLIDACVMPGIDTPSPLTSIESRELDLHAQQLVNERPEFVASVIDGIPAELHTSPTGDRTAALIQTCQMLSQLFADLANLQSDNEYRYTQKDASVPDPLDAVFITANAMQLSGIKSFLTPRAEEIKQNEAASYRVSAQYEQFKREKAGSIKAKTLSHYDIAFNVLQEAFGDVDVRTMDKKMAVNIKREVMSRQGRDEKLLSAKRVNHYLSNYRTFMSWYLEHSDEERPNPFTGLDVEENRNTQRFQRRVFKTAELAGFNQYKFNDNREAKSIRRAAYWFPRIAQYSGMRLNEIASLTPERVRQQDGIWVFDLMGLSLKNEPSQRLVPIHDALLDLGIVEFAAQQKNAQHKRLFNELAKSKDGYGQAVSKWFNRTMLRNVGIDKDEEHKRGIAVDFHCFRTTLINYLVHKGGQMHQIKAIVGHSNEDDVTVRNYTMIHVGLPVLKTLINQIPRTS